MAASQAGILYEVDNHVCAKNHTDFSTISPLEVGSSLLSPHLLSQSSTSDAVPWYGGCGVGVWKRKVIDHCKWLPLPVMG